MYAVFMLDPVAAVSREMARVEAEEHAEHIAASYRSEEFLATLTRMRRTAPTGSLPANWLQFSACVQVGLFSVEKLVQHPQLPHCLVRA